MHLWGVFGMLSLRQAGNSPNMFGNHRYDASLHPWTRTNTAAELPMNIRMLGHDCGQNTLLLSGMSWNICFPLLALHSALWMKFTPATGVYIQLQDYTTKTKNLLGNLRTIFPSCQACLLIPTPFQFFIHPCKCKSCCLSVAIFSYCETTNTFKCSF